MVVHFWAIIIDGNSGVISPAQAAQLLVLPLFLPGPEQGVNILQRIGMLLSLKKK